MEDIDKYLDEEFIIWNCTFGIRDFVNIGKIKKEKKDTNIWLDVPYDMVGPLSLEELISKGKVKFEACMVMTKMNWNKTQGLLKKESFQKQQKIYQEFQKDTRKYNKRKRESQTNINQKEYRKLLSLPLEGKLNISQIKAAYKKAAKKEHPDVGGSDERFVLITQAKDELLLIY